MKLNWWWSVISWWLFEAEKLVRKQVRREKIERQHCEMSRLRTLLRLNTVLAGLARDNVKSDFLTGRRGAAVSSTDSSQTAVVIYWWRIVDYLRIMACETCDFWLYKTDLVFGSRPGDHYFRSVCLFVCAEFFSAVFDPISIKLGHMLYVWVLLCPLEYRGCATPGGRVTPKKLVFLGVLGLKNLVLQFWSDCPDFWLYCRTHQY